MTPAKHSMLGLSADLASGAADALSIVSTALERAKESSGIFISLREDEALAEAEAAAIRRRQGKQLGPLDGVPIAVKDIIDVEGSLTTSGSRSRMHDMAAHRDASVVAALRRQGLIVIGKTNLSEFAFSGLGLNPHFGTPVPAFAGADARAPGGSSSGSAVAVQRGIVSAAIGTDTAGSIRVPSAFNGLIGFKSSVARYSLLGVHPLAPSLDSLGPIATSVADCVLLDGPMRGGPPALPASLALASLDFVVEEETLLDREIEPDVRNNLLATMATLERSGAKVRFAVVDPFRRALRLIKESGWLGAMEAWSQLGSIVGGPDSHLIDPRVKARLIAASALAPEALTHVLIAREKLIKAMREALGASILITPTVKHVAPELRPLEEDDALFSRVNLSTLSLTMPGSLLDMPGPALPSGRNAQGLPTSVLFSVSAGRDDALLAAGLAIEAALNHSKGGIS